MTRRLHRDWLALVLVALAVRGGVLAARFESLGLDPDGYRRLAVNVVRHGVLGHGEVPSAFRPPLYPLMVAACEIVSRDDRWALAALHLGAGVATVLLTFHLGRRWGLQGWAWAAALVVAVDPLLLMQSTLVMTETLAALLAVVSLAAITWYGKNTTWRRAAAAGGSIGLAALCRPTFFPWAAAVAGWLVIESCWSKSTGSERSRGAAAGGMIVPQWRKGVGGALALLVGVFIVMSPWAIRNQIHFGRPILATTHGGYTLLLGNNPSFYEYLRSGGWGEVWWSDELDAELGRRLTSGQPSDELRNDRLAYDEAKRNIRREPAMFLYASLVRVGRLWSLLPHQVSEGESVFGRLARYSVGLWYAAVLGLAALGAVALARQSIGISPAAVRGWIAAMLLVLSFTAVHAVYWTDMRMRAPLMPVVALAAGAGLRRLLEGGGPRASGSSSGTSNDLL